MVIDVITKCGRYYTNKYMFLVSTGDTTGEEDSLALEDIPNDGVVLNPQGRITPDNVPIQIRRKLSKKQNVLRIGTWNVRTLKKTGKLHLILHELEEVNVDIAGLSEIRWTGEGHFRSGDSTVIFSGGINGQGGVAVLLNKRLSGSLISYNPVSDRIVVVRLATKPVNMTVIQVYAPTSTHPDEEIEAFYEQLQAVKDEVRRRDVCVIMGDFNAKVGEVEDRDSGVGKYGLGERNESGEKLSNFCKVNDLVITNTCFKHHVRNRYTWVSPDGRTRNQIDYIAIDKTWFSSVLDAKTYPGADGDSDHNLTMAKVCLKAIRSRKKEDTPLRLDLCRFADGDVKNSYAVETQYRFESLIEHWDENDTINRNWSKMEEIWIESATEILGEVKKQKKKPWISEEVMDIAAKKREAKKKGDTAEYSRLKRGIQRLIRRDKNVWLENECAQIDEYDRLGKAKELYNKIKVVKKRPFHANQACINDKNSNAVTDPEKVLKRWHEYGANLFGKPENERPLSIHNPEELEPPPLLDEVVQAVRMLKCGKTPGLDGVPAELIQNSGPASIRVLLKLCTQIWNSLNWPDAWMKQEIVMIHKTGNTKECTNYRTITLLSHASKVLLIIILKRMRVKIEQELPDEQAGFRRGRGTADMLVALQILIEKTLEVDGQAFIVFIDYSKAFDSISQTQLFDILSEMGFPKHLVSLLEALYINQLAVIRWNGSHTNAFNIDKGVRQGCILSPHLFSLYTESVMREAEIGCQDRRKTNL